MEKIEYEFSTTTHSYEIKEFETTLSNVQKFIEENGHLTLTIQNDDDFKAIKKTRTEIRKKLDAVKSLRLAANEAVLGKFNEQSKEIEKVLNNADKVLKGKVDEWKDKDKPVEPTIYTLTIKSTEKALLEKALEKIEKIGLKGEIK